MLLVGSCLAEVDGILLAGCMKQEGERGSFTIMYIWLLPVLQLSKLEMSFAAQRKWIPRTIVNSPTYNITP